MKQFILAFAFIFCGLATCRAQIQDDNLKINKIQVIGSHNSYRYAIEPALFKAIQAEDTTRDLSGLEYEHIAINKQLDMGLRSLEIDVYPDSKGGMYAHPKGLDLAKPEQPYDPQGKMLNPGFKVFHMPDVDFRTQFYTFEDALKALKTWSDANPDHVPVFITLEPKGGETNHFGTVVEPMTSERFDELDNVIKTNLGTDKLITPDMVRGNYKTLEEAVLHNNWPTLGQAKGKFMFILDNHGEKRDLYIKGHPSLKGGVIFVNADPGTPEAATLFRNEPEDAAIPELVKKGYFVRTRADANTEEARKNDYSRFELAEKSGAQVITTDYYQPSKMFKSSYHIKFDDKVPYVRLNPVLVKK
ncbi:phosphatidylinositol-specific phospholipase C1-like protein [Flavobacterium rhizosphaerae]|uniref:Phosphatidylinositol-specific phospholipase C1-like protein n=1 Tax=Flavobacterium rhizosphaerae TaxID=3163298 RepID=A0ABW8YUN3_9FLAO